MSSETIARVHYFDRQYLRREDFSDEQRYHLDALRRHLIGQHVWGIAGGLELTAGEEGLFVEPGTAVDGYGRPIVLGQRRPLPTTAFDDKGSDVLEVWLVYDRSASDPAAPGYAPCGVSGTDVPSTRWLEEPIVRLEVPDPAFPDPRLPKSVPDGDLDFDPSRPLPDDPSDDWPIFLGKVRRDASDPEEPVFTADPVGRPYVGAVASSIAAPWQRDEPRLLLGGDEGAAAFEVRLPDEAEAALEVDQDGSLTARGPVTIHGDLEIRDGVLELPIPASFGADGGEVPGPWRIYRTRVPGSMENSASGQQGEPPTEELRIEMGPVDGELVVGFFSAETKSFERCLTVDCGGTVTVHGDLVVEGQIHDSTPRASAGLGAEATQLLKSTFLGGVTGTATFLDQLSGAVVARPDVMSAFAARLRGTEAGASLAQELAKEKEGDS